MLGQLCRNGANILDIEAANKPSSKNCTECLELCVRWGKQRCLQCARNRGCMLALFVIMQL
jgi:hypothetical protein